MHTTSCIFPHTESEQSILLVTYLALLRPLSILCRCHFYGMMLFVLKSLCGWQTYMTLQCFQLSTPRESQHILWIVWKDNLLPHLKVARKLHPFSPYFQARDGENLLNQDGLQVITYVLVNGLPVAINTPPPKQFKMEKIKFTQFERFFMGGTRWTQKGNRTAIVVTTAITTSSMDFIRFTETILIDDLDLPATTNGKECKFVINCLHLPLESIIFHEK